MSSLRKKTLGGVAWAFAERFSIQIITFAISVILARILMPEDFGLIGMIAVFIAVGDSLRDSGMTQSLIRTAKPSDRDFSTVFVINLGASVIIYALLYVLAPLIANFFEKAVLSDIIRVLSLKIPIGAIASVQNIRLVKAMNFKKQLSIQLPANLIGGIGGILFAYAGYGVWSIVYMNLIQIVLSTLQLWLRSDWTPTLTFSKKLFSKHFNFGYKLTLSGLLNVIYDNIYNIIIGKYYSAAQLGFYTRANATKQLPVNNISNALNKVTYPMFAEIQDDDKRMKQIYKKVMQQVLFWITPILSGAAVLAEPLFRLVFTEKWLPAVPYFQLLCIIGVMYPLHSYNLNILKVKGKSNVFLKVEVYKKIQGFIGVLLVIPYGIYALIFMQIFSNIVAYFINSYFSGKLIDYGVKEQLKHITPIFGLSIMMIGVCYATDWLIVANFNYDLLRILVVCIVGAAFYLLIAHFSRMEPYLEFKTIIARKK